MKNKYEIVDFCYVESIMILEISGGIKMTKSKDDFSPYFKPSMKCHEPKKRIKKILETKVEKLSCWEDLGKDENGYEISIGDIDCNEHTGTTVEVYRTKSEEIDNPNYEFELKKYNEAKNKYAIELKEWKKKKKEYDLEMAKSLEIKERNLLKSLKEKYEH